MIAAREAISHEECSTKSLWETMVMAGCSTSSHCIDPPLPFVSGLGLLSFRVVPERPETSNPAPRIYSMREARELAVLLDDLPKVGFLLLGVLLRL